MLLYHGTSKNNLESIKLEGVTAPSYWGTFLQAREHADSYGEDGIVISSDIDEDALCASSLMAECLDEEESDEAEKEDSLQFSMEFLGGLTCNDVIFEFDIVE